MRLSDLRPIHIQRLYRKMQDDGLSPRVIRYTHAVLSSALKQAVEWEMLFRNPAAVVDLPRLERKEMRAMTPDEASAFLAAVSDTRMSALFILALTTGMRPQEYLALKGSDVNLDKATATMRRAIVWSQKKGVSWRFDEPIDIPTLTKQWFKPALVKAELPVFRLYDLRHTHAALLLSKGENPKVASERLVHSTIVLTLDT